MLACVQVTALMLKIKCKVNRMQALQQQYFISPHDYYNIHILNIYIQQMIGVLAARNNLKVKNARQPVERKDI